MGRLTSTDLKESSSANKLSSIIYTLTSFLSHRISFPFTCFYIIRVFLTLFFKTIDYLGPDNSIVLSLSWSGAKPCFHAATNRTEQKRYILYQAKCSSGILATGLILTRFLLSPGWMNVDKFEGQKMTRLYSSFTLTNVQ